MFVMAAKYVSPLAADVDLRLRHRGKRSRSVVTAGFGGVVTAVIASIAVVALVVAGVGMSMLLPESSAATPASFLATTSTSSAPQPSVHRGQVIVSRQERSTPTRSR